MSSHREAPEISQDPVADNTDTYAFVSPDDPTTVTILTNYIPLQDPPGGPNFFEFGDDVLYVIYIDNDGDAIPEIAYQFQFQSQIANPNTFLYNTGPITSLTSSNWNKRQTYTVTRVTGKDATVGGPGGGPSASAAANHEHNGKHEAPEKGSTSVLGKNLACPPCNIGPRSTPNYAALASAAIAKLPSGETVFAGQRQDGFFVDLGAIFDLADLRPFQNLHLIPSAAAMAVDATKSLNVHSIALKVPINRLTGDGSTPTDATKANSVLGIWGAAYRRRIRMIDPANDALSESGPWVQVSRLGNPLFNEVIVPLGKKDEWNAGQPSDDKEYLPNVQHPELAGLLPVLYPNVFPNLAKLSAPRADLVAVLLTGLPSGVVPNFQNYTGKTPADMLRLNVAIPPTTTNPNPFGLLGNDAAGFPNGRRVFDDVVGIELRAIAGVTYTLIDKTYTLDAAASLLTEGLTPPATRYQSTFPYLSTPLDGYDNPAS